MHLAITANRSVDKKKITLALLLMAIIAFSFWTQSRMPALDSKAQMGQRTSISSIAFDTILEVDPEQIFIQRVAYSSLNWAYTNWKGMSFGLLFASAFLTLLKNLPKSNRPRNAFLSALQGTAIGVPLGVCANCATPIAQGMHKAGSRLEVVLATLMSSPTLNIIVLSMMFTLLPFHLVVIKLVSVFVFILIVMPILVKILESNADSNGINLQALKQLENSAQGKTNTETNSSCNITSAEAGAPITSWKNACKNIISEYFDNLLYIVKTTLPLMILAGILGAFVIEAIPFGILSSLEITLLTLFLVATLGVFLPVPIAFDIIVVATLLASGLPVAFAMTLLFSLGIFSIYPALVIARHISVSLSISLFISCALVATLAGYAADYVDTYISDKNTQRLDIALSELSQNRQANKDLVLVVDICHKTESRNDESVCLFRAIHQHLSSAPSLVSCEKNLADDTVLMAACRLGVQHKSGLNKPNDCLSATPQALRDRCLFDLPTEKPGELSGTSICPQIQSPFLSIECTQREQPFHRSSNETEALAQCETLAGLARTKCFRALYMRTAYFSEGKSDRERFKSNICQALKDSGLHTECYEYRARRVSEKSGDLENCMQINNPDIRSACVIGSLLVKLDLQQKIRHQMTEVTAKTPANTTNIKPLENGAIPEAIQWINFSDTLSSNFPETNKNMTISYRADAQRNTQTISTQHGFSQINAESIGLDHQENFVLPDFFEPFRYGRGVTSGDYNNDDRPDLAFSSAEGLLIYRNTGNGQFIRENIDLSWLEISNSFVISFVDINNDGWLDLFLSTYAGPNYFIINNEGKWNTDKPIIMKDNNRVVTLSAGFSDQDRDGDLDFYLGNWSFGMEKHFNAVFSQNYWMINNEGVFDSVKTDEILGETLSVLLSDVNNDSYTDLLIANDRDAPDLFYLGKAAGGFDKRAEAGGLLPIAPTQTMSIDSADFNNDLLMDIFSADLKVGAGPDKPYCSFLSKGQSRCQSLIADWQAVNKLDVNACNALTNTQDKYQCLSSIAIMLAKRKEDMGLCDLIPAENLYQQRFCKFLAQSSEEMPSYKLATHIRQVPGIKLLMGSASGQFIDTTFEAGVDNSWWAWNSKAADLDNDEWQDIYASNGFSFGEPTSMSRTHSNVFYHNQGNGRFIKAEQPFGLVDYVNTSSYTYVDLDIDGDLDIVATGTMSPPRVFINNEKNNSVSFILRDEKGNRFCVGCKLIISYGEDGKKKQLRELKLSGGFLSFDELVIHFGLSDYQLIKRVEVIWSDGESSIIEQNMPANRRYKIERKTPTTPQI